MQQVKVLNEALEVEDNWKLIIEENKKLGEQISFNTIPEIIKKLNTANNIFLIGAGRTGFMIKAASMRLMHLGYSVYVVGETNTPAIMSGDVLIAASGSGTTSQIVRAAQTASNNNATIITFTTNLTSPLAELASLIVHIPAAGKQELNKAVSLQYAGSLFEQSFLLVFDAIIQNLWKNSGLTRDELWKRHANME